MIDSFSILGLSPNADQRQIRSAYRTLAKTCHPDSNTGDNERFYQIKQAYEKLSQLNLEMTDQRAGNRHQFLHIFSKKRRPKMVAVKVEPSEVTVKLHVEISDLMHGAKRQVTLDNGKSVEIQIPQGHSPTDKLKLTIDHNTTVLVQLLLKSDEQRQVSGRNLHMDIALGLWEMRQGLTRKISSPAGRLAIHIPTLSSPGQTLRIKGKGLPKNANSAAGDLFLKLVEKPHTDIKPVIEQFARAFIHSAELRQRHLRSASKSALTKP